VSNTNASAESPIGTGEREAPHREGAGPGMRQTMAQMMAHCCGSETMARIAALMGGCGPSKPAEPAPKKP
jgi:hypothetical protein